MLISRFQVVLCDTNEARDYHYELRYQVFCEETGFEDPHNFPNHRETDDYDNVATHFLVWDRLTRRWVGAMRFVDATRTALPSERICKSRLEGLDRLRNRSAEFSRLSILRDCRRTPTRDMFGLHRPNALATVETIPIFFSSEKNDVLLQMLWASGEWAKESGIGYFYFIVTAALARIFKRCGIPLTLVGTEVRHRGVRRPYRYNVHEALRGISATFPEFAKLARTEQPFVLHSEFRTTPSRSPRTCNPAYIPQVNQVVARCG